MPFEPTPKRADATATPHPGTPHTSTPDPGGFPAAPPADNAPSADTAPAGGPDLVMHIEPDKVIPLKRELEAVRLDIADFLARRTHSLYIRPMAGDPVSHDFARAFNKNAAQAISVTKQFAAELKKQIVTLEEAVKTYNLTEETNTSTFKDKA